MAGDNIVPLREGTFVPEKHYEPQPEVIAELEELLAEARAGAVVGVAYATYYSNNTSNNRYVGFLSRSVVGGLFAVMSRVSRLLDED